MKLSKHAYITFWDVHAWGSVVCALLLHFMFFFGAFTLFKDELRWWENHSGRVQVTSATLADVPALIDLVVPPDSKSLSKLSVYLGERPGVGYELEGTAQVYREVDVRSRTSGESPQTHLGDWFEDLHYLSHDSVPWLERVAGITCILLGLALATGVLIQLKDLVRQLTQLRRGRGIQVFWSDLHKVLGVWGIPFFLLFAWSGALLTLEDWGESAVSHAIFSGDEDASKQALSSRPQAGEPGETKSPMLPIPQLIKRLQAELSATEFTFVRFHHPGTSGGTLEAGGFQLGTFEGYSRALLSLEDGALIKKSVAGIGETPWEVWRRWLYELHFGEFGGPGVLGVTLRILYACGAFAGCFLFLTGNWIWLARRDRKRASVGNRILARLTIGFGSGLCVAAGALFVGSRLLPLNQPGRTALELLFVIVWGLTLVWAFLPKRELAAWWQQFACAALLFALAPVVALRYSSAGLLGAVIPGAAAAQATVVGADVMLVALASACGWLAWKLRRVCAGEPSEPSTR